MLRKSFDFIKRHATAAAFALLFTSAFAIAQGFVFIAQNGTATGPSIYGTGDATTGFSFAQTGALNLIKHVVTSGGTTPALSSCGTSPSLTTGSTDVAGKFTVGTTASNACTLTFGVAYTSAPFCVIQNATTGAGAFSATVGASTIVLGGTLADSSVIFYHCMAPSGG